VEKYQKILKFQPRKLHVIEILCTEDTFDAVHVFL
jgi:hypothetical protein